MRSRADLINNKRKTTKPDKLPKESEGMYDVLTDFEPGVGKYIHILNKGSTEQYGDPEAFKRGE